MSKRINITLPDSTVNLLNRAVKKGQRSHLIDQAIQNYIKKRGHTLLRKQLSEGAKRNAVNDLELAAEWFNLDEEAWQESGH